MNRLCSRMNTVVTVGGMAARGGCWRYCGLLAEAADQRAAAFGRRDDRTAVAAG
jgi:hypothetical protein